MTYMHHREVCCEVRSQACWLLEPPEVVMIEHIRTAFLRAGY